VWTQDPLQWSPARNCWCGSLLSMRTPSKSLPLSITIDCKYWGSGIGESCDRWCLWDWLLDKRASLYLQTPPSPRQQAPHGSRDKYPIRVDWKTQSRRRRGISHSQEHQKICTLLFDLLRLWCRFYIHLLVSSHAVYSNNSYAFLHPNFLSSPVLPPSHSGPSSQERISVTNLKPHRLPLSIILPNSHFPPNDNHDLSLGLHFLFYFSLTHNLPSLLVVKTESHINLSVLLCPYVSVCLSNFPYCYPLLLTNFSIYWLSSSYPCLFIHRLLIHKLPSFPAT
jgi:hypothetical protein